MNIIIAKHNNSEREYVFEVPDGMGIQKDQIILVNTSKGKNLAIATTGIISGAGAVDLAVSKGAYFPLKTVICIVPKEVVEYYNGKFSQALSLVAEIEKENTLFEISDNNDEFPF